MSLTLREIIMACVERSNRWHPDGVFGWSLSDWAVAMGGECGEAQNVVKKLNRDRDGMVGNRGMDKADLWDALGEEIADTILYAVLLAARAGIDLEDAIIGKFNAVSEREGFAERLYPSSQGAADVLIERARQVAQEGWDADHDDAHGVSPLAFAAGAYLLSGARTQEPERGGKAAAAAAAFVRDGWPFEADWWKPRDARRDIIRGLALGLAALDVLDRRWTRDLEAALGD